MPALGVAGELLRHLDQARQRARRLHHGDRGLAAERVRPRQRHDEIQAFVVDARKGMRRIQPDGGQQRHHVAVEHFARPFLLLRIPFGRVMQGDALRVHGGKDLVVQQVVLAPDQFVHGLLDVLERHVRGHAVGPHQVRRLALLLLQAGNPDLEEFVQVGTDNAHIAQSFEQGRFRILRHRQHTFIEFQQRQLAIHEQGLGGRA